MLNPDMSVRSMLRLPDGRRSASPAFFLEDKAVTAPG